MANKVKVDHTAISDAVLNISKAIDTYNTLAQTGFDTAISSLDGMNSDYIDKLQQVLDCLNPKIKEEISDIKVLAKVAMKAQKIFLLYNLQIMLWYMEFEL